MSAVKEIPAYIEKLMVPKELRNVMNNAKTQNRDDIYWVAFRRLCALEGMNHNDPLHRDFYQVLAAYESLLTQKNARTTKANRTRQKLSRHSVEKCLEDWALSSTPTQGFNLLVSAGLSELTAEYLVVKYADRFEPHVVKAAQQRLNKGSSV
jgi:hypothetical protein